MAAGSLHQSSHRALLRRVSNILRSTERLLQGQDITIAELRDAGESISICEVQLQRLLSLTPNLESGQAVLRDIAKYKGLLHEEEVKLLQHGRPRTSYQASKFTLGKGAPVYQITKRQLQLLLGINCSVVTISDVLGVSLSTVRRRMKQYGLSVRDRYSDIADPDLDDLVKNITEFHPGLGYRSVLAQLNSQGIKLQENRIRESMIRVDQVAVAMRWGNAVQRRTYHVATPNTLWHIDGNHKLIRWKIIIHGGIDGYSRMITYLKAAPNNLGSTVLTAFMNAVDKFGMPARVRMDCGVENNQVFAFMEQRRPGSAIKGRSVHNQRIERLWVDLYQGVVHTCQTTFRLLEEMNILDVDCDDQMFCLHYVYLPRLQHQLDEFRQRYNCHPLSTSESRTPQQLFTIGTLSNFHSSHRGITGQEHTLNVQYTPSIEEHETASEETETPAVELSPIQCPLSEGRLQELQQAIPPVVLQDSLGVGTYKRVVEFVMSQH